MKRFCTKCGKELSEETTFCPNCGEATNKTNTTTNTNRPVITERNIAIAVILSFVTCGIYGLYWLIVMTDESNSVSDEKTASGGMTILLTIVTCGIYMIYWNYKMGQKMYTAGKRYNLPIADNSILYLILSLFGLSIVNYCMIQNDLNRFAQ